MVLGWSFNLFLSFGVYVYRVLSSSLFYLNTISNYIRLTADSPREVKSAKLDTHRYDMIHHLGRRTVTAAVSPWYLTHYGYDESHYVGPVKGAQPNSQAWEDTFPQTPWLELTAYFARAFKQGVCPPIGRDRVSVVPRPDRWHLFWVVILSTDPAQVYLSAVARAMEARVAALGGP
ncbi:hypothetical protein V8D89_001041 [Ganoderma adspersum]